MCCQVQIQTHLQARLWLVKDLVSNVYLQFMAWTCLPVLLVLFSTGFVHVVAPQVGGRGQ